MISILATTKGHTFVNNVGGVMILILCISSDNAYLCTQFRKNFSEGFTVMEQTLISILKFTKRHN